MAEEIKDISLSTKKGFRIDGDNNRMIYLDTSDMNIAVRLEEAYPKIQKLAVEATERMGSVKKITEEDSSGLNDMAGILKDIDNQMREYLDYIFASKISDVCEPTGNLFDVVGGEFRFEHIIEVLGTLYANNFTVEFKKMQTRLNKHTAKYANKRKK